MKIKKHNEEITYIDYSKLPEGLRPKDPNFKSINIASMFDAAFMESFGLNSQEYDRFCEHGTDEELDYIFETFGIDKPTTFSQRRKCLVILNKYKDGKKNT